LLKRIYPDTNIWDQLCDQQVNPKEFMDLLAAKGFTLVISFHTVYELARSFTSNDSQVISRGRRLCGYVKQFLELGTPCTKEFWELIIAEVDAFQNNLPQIDPMATPEQSTTTRLELEKLANGVVEERVKQFLEKRLNFAMETRTKQRSHIDNRAELKDELKAIPQAQLAEWMQKEVFRPEGVSTLYQKVIKRMGQGPTMADILELLRYPIAEASRASVRGDLYYNWHCAEYSGIRLDLLDDILHLLQAVYCDLYISEDKGQGIYGPLILTARTRVEIYRDRTIPIKQWILGLL
jgi:hypothetical protein